MKITALPAGEIVPLHEVPEGSYFKTPRGVLCLLAYEDVPGQGKEVIRRYVMRMETAGTLPVGQVFPLDSDALCTICDAP